MKTKDEYIEKLTSELKEWSAQIDILTARTEIASADLKLKYAEELEELRSKQHAAAEKLKELEDASGDAWKTVKETADKVWNDLRTGLADVTSKFK
jgi:chromosome segregation ATPase